jgi:hypothetical protein
VQLAFDARPGIGYLPAVLSELHVPLESQLLVYSKTSLQRHLITPERPRALYFNDELAVGSVQDGMIEIAVQDAKQGAVFYTLQRVAEQPRLERQGSCLGCHHTLATLGVPGFFARSIPTAADGQILPWLGNAIVDHATPLAERWGGWYVTGDVGSQAHYGNVRIADNRAQALPSLPIGVHCLSTKPRSRACAAPLVSPSLSKRWACTTQKGAHCDSFSSMGTSCAIR